MKKIYFLLTFIVFTTTVMAQTKGISYQAVLYDPAYKNQTLPGVDNTLIPYANKPVCLRFQITDKNNQAVYIETQSTKTDPFGMVNLIIGQGTKIGGLVSSFENINWNAQANGLIVSLDNSGNCSNFTEVTNQPFTASPFSLGTTSINTADFELIANKSNNINVDANSTTKYPSVNAIKSYVDSKVGTIPDADATTKGKIQLTGDLGGTASLPTVPGLALKVDKEVGKGLSTNDFTTIEKTKLGAIIGTNTGDQTSVTGNAGTATKLAAAKNINGVPFDGSADIIVTAEASTLTGVILASNVLSSSLTSVGTLTNLTVTNTISGSVSGNAATVTTNANLTGSITSVGNATTITDSAVTNAKLDKANIPLSGFGVALVDVAIGAKKLTGVADPIDAQDAATKAYADTKASKVEITSTEIALPTKINAKQLYSKSGTLSVTSGTTSATIPAITDLTDYYSIRIFKDGKPFRNEVRSFSPGVSGNPIAIVTGNGMMSEIYPSGSIYTYVLEYIKIN